MRQLKKQKVTSGKRKTQMDVKLVHRTISVLCIWGTAGDVGAGWLNVSYEKEKKSSAALPPRSGGLLSSGVIGVWVCASSLSSVAAGRTGTSQVWFTVTPECPGFPSERETASPRSAAKHGRLPALTSPTPCHTVHPPGIAAEQLELQPRRTALLLSVRFIHKGLPDDTRNCKIDPNWQISCISVVCQHFLVKRKKDPKHNTPHFLLPSASRCSGWL